MNCQHCIALIEACPLGELTPSQLDAVERHCDACAHCREALSSARALEQQLLSLPDPSVPAGLEETIMRRLLQIEPNHALATTPRSSTSHDLAPSRPIVLGCVLAVVTQCYALLAGKAHFALAMPFLHGGIHGLATMPHSTGVGIALSIGLLLLLAGLSASLDSAET